MQQHGRLFFQDEIRYAGVPHYTQLLTYTPLLTVLVLDQSADSPTLILGV
jgi:hypothetical protein